MTEPDGTAEPGAATGNYCAVHGACGHQSASQD